MVDQTFERLLQVRGGGVMGKWLPKFVRVQAGVLEVFRDPEGNGAPGTTARLEDISDVTIDEAKDECIILLTSGGKIRARADDPEVLNLFADALQPGHDPANLRKPKVVLQPNTEADSPDAPTASIEPEPDLQDLSGKSLENLPVHERLYKHAALQQAKLEQKRQQQVMEEDQAIEESLEEWNKLKHEKEKRHARDPNFLPEDPRDFHERSQAYEIEKQQKIRRRREELLIEEEMRLEEERQERDRFKPRHQLGQNYDPYEAADRLYRNALQKDKRNQGDGVDFSEAARKRRTDEELRKEEEEQKREAEEQKRKEKQKHYRDYLVNQRDSREKQKKDQPGDYIVIKETKIKETVEKGSRTVGEAKVHMRVRVVEVMKLPAQKRVLGRLEHPAGWISLLNTEDGSRWAEQEDEERKMQRARDSQRKAEMQENRRKSQAFIQRNARPKSSKRSASPDKKPGSPKAKGSWPRSPRSTSPTKPEDAEARAPTCGRKSQIAKRAQNMHELEKKLVEEDLRKLNTQHEKDKTQREKDAKFAKRLWGSQQARHLPQQADDDASGVETADDADQSLDARSPRCSPPVRDKETHLLERLCERIEARTGEEKVEALFGPRDYQMQMEPQDEGSDDRQTMEHSLKRVRALYAAAEAESRSDGFDDLCKIPNSRLVRGTLQPEGQDATRTRAGAPDPIFQQMENLDGLIEAGEAAQTVLMEELQEPWEVGETLQLPANVPTALFAYNPGSMSKGDAETKAMVLYGPMDGAQCHRNLLDVARLTLVFPTCTVLKLGLDAVRNLFEVVKVHNYFRDPTPLGSRYVDAFVLIDLSQDPGLPYPFVCKLRLETLPYFQATSESNEVLEGLYNSLCGNDVSRVVAQSFLEYPDKKLARECRRKFEAAYGSTLAAWRHTFGRKRLATFDAFREANDRLRGHAARTPGGDHLHETWNQFDPSLAGRITYFDFDPDSASLLTKLRSRFMMLYAYGDQLDEHKIYEQMTCLIAPKKPMEWDVNEFKAVMRPFCMTTTEIDKVMQLLDQHGGKQNPVIIRIQDVMFLLRLPDMFDVDFAVISSLNMVSKAPPPRAGFGYAGEDGRIHVAGSPRSESPGSPKPKLMSGLTKHLALPAYDEEF